MRQRTGVLALDTDEIVASKFRMSIPEIFAEHGERKFREAETEALREVRPEEQKIIVTGGGVVLRTENVEILKKQGVIVWLDGDEDTLFLRARRSLYADMADVRIDTSVLTDEEVAVAILAKLRRINPRREPAISAKA